MLLWQQDKAKLLILGPIFCAIVLAHLCTLGMLFFITGRSSIFLMVTMHKVLPGQRVVVLPCYKKIMQNVGKHYDNTSNITSFVKKKNAVTKKASSPATPNKKRQKTSVEKAKKVAKQPKPIPIKKSVDQKQSKDHTEIVSNSDMSNAIAAARDTNTVYLDRQEHEIFMLYEQIQSEVARCWRPPKGVDPDTACTIKLCIDWHGAIEQCIIVQPSGVFMFDVSVRTSLKAIIFPRASYGKEIILTFVQEKRL